MKGMLNTINVDESNNRESYLDTDTHATESQMKSKMCWQELSPDEEYKLKEYQKEVLRDLSRSLLKKSSNAKLSDAHESFFRDVLRRAWLSEKQIDSLKKEQIDV
jgi:hypothetical protein